MTTPRNEILPPNPFSQSKENFQCIGTHVFALKFVEPQIQLPDLRSEMIYLGRAQRPDMVNCCYLMLKNGDTKKVCQNEKIYLQYIGNKKGEEIKGKGYYHFSSLPTPFSLDLLFLSDKTITCQINLQDSKGTLIQTPHEFLNFSLEVQENNKYNSSPWHLDDIKVDSSLFAKQKAKWFGTDKFLELHGGEEFSHVNGRERIDFLGEHPYHCFVKTNDYLIWKESRWQEARDQESTCGYPLLLIKKIDDKLMSCELWDTEGMNKQVLNLIKQPDHSPFLDLTSELKFVGTKTWTQFILENRTNKKMTVKLQDWLLLNHEGWNIITTQDAIDDYVSHKLTGQLFVIDEVVKINGKNVLKGHLFNATRTRVENFELSSISTSNFSSPMQLETLALPNFKNERKNL